MQHQNIYQYSEHFFSSCSRESGHLYIYIAAYVAIHRYSAEVNTITMGFWGFQDAPVHELKFDFVLNLIKFCILHMHIVHYGGGTCQVYSIGILVSSPADLQSKELQMCTLERAINLLLCIKYHFRFTLKYNI